MKTATITWITYNNYGTELQAYALQQFLKNEGIYNDIISDQNIVNQYKTSQEINTAVNESLIPQKCANLTYKLIYRIKKYAFHPAVFCKTLYQYCVYKKEAKKRKIYDNSQQAFETFKKEHLKIVYGMYRKDMVSLNQMYDAFLCGSDQIWSVLEQNFDGYFYLDFVEKTKIAYATSIGTERVDQEHGAKITEWLKNYKAIAVREQKTAKQLSELTGKEIEWVVDPTLLHDKVFWSNFCADTPFPKNKYLLCYFLTDKSWYFEYASDLAKYLHLKLLLIPSKASYTKKKECYCKTVGPIEFVSLFQHAQYVLTDSYHGSIFSMLFEKDFIYLKRFYDSDPICQNIRVYSLFQKLGLLNHIVEERNFSPDDIQIIDYNRVNKIIMDFRKQSIQFLHNALSKV